MRTKVHADSFLPAEGTPPTTLKARVEHMITARGYYSRSGGCRVTQRLLGTAMIAAVIVARGLSGRFIYVRHGAQGEAYRAIVASGGNAWFAHHRASDKVMTDGELVLRDYCPNLHYYRCDVTRQWPVNGTFSPGQRELYTFYLGVYEAILYSIKPHVTAQAILQDAVRKMDAMMATMKFSKPLYEKAAKEFVGGYRRRAHNTTGRALTLDMPSGCPRMTWAGAPVSCGRDSSSRSSRSFGFRKSAFFSVSRT